MKYETNRDGHVICPECMQITDRDELDTFGGLCEGCTENSNN